MSTIEPVIYRINDIEEIVFVNAAWTEFAQTNEGETVLPPSVLGHSLWDFISDETTKSLYRDMVRRVRDGHPVHVSLRCDSPDRVRRLKLETVLLDSGEIEFRVHTIAEEHREPRLLLKLDVPRSEEQLKVCSWCKRMETDRGWLEIDEAIEELELFETPPLPELSHGMCPDCHGRVTAELEA